MLYTPLESEKNLFADMSADERFHYAITRINESEEVWSLGNDNGWCIENRQNRQVISIWPYRALAEECCTGAPDSPAPQSTSLEHFLYGVLDMCEEKNILLEVFPGTSESGLTLEPSRLYEIMNGMLESSEYFIEG